MEGQKKRKTNNNIIFQVVRSSLDKTKLNKVTREGCYFVYSGQGRLL